ncbi:ATP-binding protein [Asinibacterium sp. OR53]|uniref:ATP-binding protein n=1 Tax=Asinibacterium sp. OR53 TaxID=925409 RepID=UPI0006872B0F|nr:ATP-binding protein [Asinibacterium sp. OR53]
MSLLLAAGNLFGQSRVADSLARILATHQREDTDKVNLMNQLAVELRRTKPQKVDSLINLALILSDKLDYKKGKGNALTVKAVRYYDVSNFSSATKTFTEAEPLLVFAHDTNGQFYLLTMRGNLLMDEGNYAPALDHFLRALKMAEQSGDVKLIADINRLLGYFYNIIGEYEKAIPYQTASLRQAESIGDKLAIGRAYNAIGKTYKTQGNYPAAMDAYTKGLRLDEARKDSAAIYVDYSNIADVYERMGKYEEVFSYVRPSLNYYLYKGVRNTMVPWNEWVIGRAFTHSGRPDSGLYYAKHALLLSKQTGLRLVLQEINLLIAESAAKLHQWDTAYKYQVISSNLKDTLRGKEIAGRTAVLQASFDLDKKQAEIDLQKAENKRERAVILMVLGGLLTLVVLAVILFRSNRQKQKANILLHKQKQEIDAKARELAIQKENLEQSYSNVELLGEIGRKITSSLSVATIIGTVYDNANTLMDATVFGIGIFNNETKQIDFPATYENGVALPFYSNSLYDQNKFAVLCYTGGKEIVMSDLEKEYQQYLQDMPKPMHGAQPLSLLYLPLKVKDKILGVITVQSFLKHAYTDYHLYMLRNISIYTAIALENAESFKKLNQTIDSLKNTQKQLIQSEKMASLGELTAGIAHEIQNPLNFVNNFSEVNMELLEEMKETIRSGNMNEALQLAEDLKQNSEKITYHGKRADSIVKGMLQHSRSSGGQKQPTDINLLTDECLRLSYHGLRAKDKSFNIKMENHFDKDLPLVSVATQDIGRVLLNLFTNAFYSVMQKQKQSNGSYEPVVAVTTKNDPGGVTITIRDNGLGIPQKVMDKIFQPFFTTKPAGEGTGLGLSLSYEIITKGHNGELKVETKEGEYAQFIIHLPNKA